MTAPACPAGSGPAEFAGLPGLRRQQLDGFTYRAMRALRAARDEAAAMRHDPVDAGHLLLGVLALEEGAGAIALRNLGAEGSAVRAAVLHAVHGAADAGAAAVHFGSQADRVLEFSAEEAKRLGHSHVGTEHILLGLLREQGGVAEGVLGSLGIDLDRARDEVVDVLESWSPGAMGSQSRVPKGE